jgi:hypothetical protein
MLREHLSEIAQRKPVKILNDVDGPGRGNAAIVIREERPKEGGILIHLLNYKYPYKGNPFQSSVDNLCIIKKNILFTIRSVSNLQTKIYLALLLFLPRIFTRGIISSVVNYYHTLVIHFLHYDFIKPERYCNCVRELYRTFTILSEKEKEEWKRKIIETARDISCMFIELDSAYKFRFQDIILELKPEEVRGKRMIKEIERLFDIMIERERVGYMKAKWQQVKRAIIQGLRVKLARKFIEEFINEVNLKKLYPDKADRYYDLLRKDYDFFGKSLPVRIKERKKIEGENWKHFEELANSFLKEYN